MMTGYSNSKPLRAFRRRLLLACAAAVLSLNLGGCALSALSALGAVGSIMSALNPGNWIDDTPNFATAGPAPMAQVDVTSDKMVRIAESARSRGDFLSAATFYQRAIAMDPADAPTIAGLGQVFLESGDATNAVPLFRAAIAIESGNVDALHGLGNALIILDKPKAAAKQFRISNLAKPSARSYNGLGVALDMTGDHRGAQKAYRTGLELEPNGLSLRNNFGLSLALGGDYQASIAILRKVAALPEATARERQNLALAYGLAGQPEMAARIARIDLGEAQVASNLAYYDWLRDQPRSATTASLAEARHPAAESASAGPSTATLARRVASAPDEINAPDAASAGLDPVIAPTVTTDTADFDYNDPSSARGR